MGLKSRRMSHVITPLKAGARFRSAVCEIEVVVVKAPSEGVDLRCGGHVMLRMGDQPADGQKPEAGFSGGTLLGKRYVDESGVLELLCTKARPSSLSLGERILEVKDAKPLPASD
jgi:hypothetical protein